MRSHLCHSRGETSDIAVPVAPPETLRRLDQYADEVVCLELPRHFRAVGEFYRTFPQVEDEQVIACLNPH